jgi:hypothetical protein
MKLTEREAMLLSNLHSLKEYAVEELFRKRYDTKDMLILRNIDYKLQLLGVDLTAYGGGTRHCSKCHQPGHNARKCPADKIEEEYSL